MSKVWAKICAGKHRANLRRGCVHEQGGRCIYCARPFTEDRPATLEHIVPVSKGGGDWKSNVAASCLPCNRERRNGSHEAFMRYKRAQMERKEKGDDGAEDG